MNYDESKLFTGYRDGLDIPSEWEDTSYGNDAMPSYELGRLRVWIDHPDKTQSEFYSPEMETFEDGGIKYTRFLVVDVSGGDGDPDDHEPLLQTNDFKEVVLFVNTHASGLLESLEDIVGQLQMAKVSELEAIETLENIVSHYQQLENREES